MKQMSILIPAATAGKTVLRTAEKTAAKITAKTAVKTKLQTKTPQTADNTFKTTEYDIRNRLQFVACFLFDIQTGV